MDKEIHTGLHNPQLSLKELLHIMPTTWIPHQTMPEDHPLLAIIIVFEDDSNLEQCGVQHDSTLGIVFEPGEGAGGGHPWCDVVHGA